MKHAINVIIETPLRINMMRGWETAADKQNRALWLDHLYNVQALTAFDKLPPANDSSRWLDHITNLEQSGKLYEYNTLIDYLEA
jgi:hypothetical protein